MVEARRKNDIVNDIAAHHSINRSNVLSLRSVEFPSSTLDSTACSANFHASVEQDTRHGPSQHNQSMQTPMAREPASMEASAERYEN
eukprot:5311783-Amphidinium_carterae.1